MNGLALLLVLFFLSRQNKGGAEPSHRVDPVGPALPPPTPATRLPPVAQDAKKAPPPWPQAMPSGLPPFGPKDWMPDEPPPPAVVTRAWQLLPVLWAKGPGAIKTEKTAARWITYQAQAMAKGKKGVVAYRERHPSTGASNDPIPTNLV